MHVLSSSSVSATIPPTITDQIRLWEQERDRSHTGQKISAAEEKYLLSTPIQVRVHGRRAVQPVPVPGGLRDRAQLRGRARVGILSLELSTTFRNILRGPQQNLLVENI